MSNAPNAPPIYRTVALSADADVTREAVRAAAAGADPATLLWVDRGDRAQCAVTLCPDTPLRNAAQMLHVGMTALGDALGAVLPPLVIVSFSPPATILLNDAVLGQLSLRVPGGCGPDDVPDWLVLAIDIGVSRFAEDSDAAIDLSLTTFEDEGCMGISTGEVSGAFARYLLSWIDRWQKDGFGPVRTGWTAHARLADQGIALQVGETEVTGRFVGLSDAGGILLQTEAGEREIGAVDLLDATNGGRA